MKFSLLMSLYHRENPKFLNSCFESLAEQTFHANEIILIFDGYISSELKEVVELWKCKLPIKVFQLPKNVGLGKALEYGLQQCSHNWVARMDTDDICFKNRFEKQIKYIAENPNVDVVGGQVVEFQDDITDSRSIKAVPLSHNEIVKFAQKRNPINHMTVMYKKSSVIEAGSYQHAPLYEDYDLWVRMILKNKRFANIDELVYARTGNAMYQRRGGVEYFKQECKMLIKFYCYGFLSLNNLLFGLFFRLPPRLMPNSIRGFIYNAFLRKNIN